MVPYSKWQSLTSPPLGLTVALSVAAVWVTDDAGVVTTVGGFTELVANVRSAPTAVPLEFVATILKW